MQSNLANTYQELGRVEEALRSRRDAYSGYLKLLGEEHENTLHAANNYAASLLNLRRFEEAKSLLRKTLRVARRVFGEDHDNTLRMRSIYACTLHNDPGATLDDLREAVTALEEIEPTARRVFGGAHPLAANIERTLKEARAALRAREPSSV